MKTKQIFYILLIVMGTFQVFAQNNKPNILFIAIDDLKPTMGAFGDEFAVTPNIDKLAKNSTVFLNNHTQQAVCGPSRASLMTGKRPDYTKVRDLKTRMRDINPNILTIPQYFKEQGYITAGTGKIYDPRCVDKFVDKPSWTIPYKREFQIPYPKKYGSPALGYYQNPDIKAKVEKLTKEGEEKGVKNVNKYVTNRYKPPYEISNVPDEAYTDGAIAQHALTLLDKVSKDDSTPFFLAVGFKRPHLPFVAPQKYWNLYDPSKIELASYQKKVKKGTDLAYHSSGEMRSYVSPEITYKVSNGLLQMDEDLQRKLIHGYYACTSFVDTQVGLILDKLKEKGLDKNTIIVVWGDHGWHLGDHSMWNKHSNFEQATRSPLMVYAPSHKAGIKVNSPTEFVDIFPTLCELSGLEIPSDLDGKSLVPILDKSQKSVKKHAVSQWHKGKNTGYSFRTEQYRYTVWIEGKKSTEPINNNDILAEELYDYIADALETENLVGKAAYANIHKKLKQQARVYFASQSTIKVVEKTTKQSGKSIKEALQENFNTDSVFVGATLGHSQLGTNVEKLFLNEFTYTTPENCAKQARVHPEPNVWNWEQIDDYIDFATKNDITVRIHGPISPQASKWAKNDDRTADELEKNMIEFMTTSCLRYNNNKTVKWMDVVNETVGRDGEWFKDKQGVDEWENPWVKMGYDSAGVPLYISKAFEISNRLAPNVSQVYNQHGGMEPAMWERVKETILYLKSKGYRIDGLGWQAHIKSTEELMLEPKSLQFLSDLIDWAHAHQLEFHVTEMDYKLMDNNNSSEALERQAKAYSNVLAMLLSKRKTGVVTFNTWGMVDKDNNKHTDMYRFIFDKKGDPKPAYFAIRKAIENFNSPLILKEN